MPSRLSACNFFVCGQDPILSEHIAGQFVGGGVEIGPWSNYMWHSAQHLFLHIGTCANMSYALTRDFKLWKVWMVIRDIAACLFIIINLDDIKKNIFINKQFLSSF